MGLSQSIHELKDSAAVQLYNAKNEAMSQMIGGQRVFHDLEYNILCFSCTTSTINVLTRRLA